MFWMHTEGLCHVWSHHHTKYNFYREFGAVHQVFCGVTPRKWVWFVMLVFLVVWSHRVCLTNQSLARGEDTDNVVTTRSHKVIPTFLVHHVSKYSHLDRWEKPRIPGLVWSGLVWYFFEVGTQNHIKCYVVWFEKKLGTQTPLHICCGVLVWSNVAYTLRMCTHVHTDP